MNKEEKQMMTRKVRSKRRSKEEDIGRRGQNWKKEEMLEEGNKG